MRPSIYLCLVLLGFYLIQVFALKEKKIKWQKEYINARHRRGEIIIVIISLSILTLYYCFVKQRHTALITIVCLNEGNTMLAIINKSQIISLQSHKRNTLNPCRQRYSCFSRRKRCRKSFFIYWTIARSF